MDGWIRWMSGWVGRRAGGLIERDGTWVSRNMSPSPGSAANHLDDLDHFLSPFSAFISSSENEK